MRKYKQKLLPTETSKSTERDQWTDIIELSQTVNQERKKKIYRLVSKIIHKIFI